MNYVLVAVRSLVFWVLSIPRAIREVGSITERRARCDHSYADNWWPTQGPLSRRDTQQSAAILRRGMLAPLYCGKKAAHLARRSELAQKSSWAIVTSTQKSRLSETVDDSGWHVPCLTHRRGSHQPTRLRIVR